VAGAGRPRLVIVGAGFGGLWAARALRNEDLDVLVVDRENYHTFLPLLYQVAAAELGPTEIAYPVRSVFRGVENVDFRMAAVLDVDFDRKILTTPVEEIPYDYLILSLGSTSHFFGIEGAEEHAFPLRTMREAMPLRHHILSRFETAVQEQDEDERRRLLTFVVVGGGPTGVEYTGALAELVHGPLRQDFPRLSGDEPRIVLLEATDRLLPELPEKLGRYAGSRLERRGAEVETGAAVSSVGPDAVRLEDGRRIPTDTVVWTAGVWGAPEAGRWGLPLVRGGRVRVRESLQVPSRDEVFVVGDLAYVEDDEGSPVPQVAPAAIQEAEHAAEGVLRLMAGEKPEAFHFRDPGMLAVIGRSAGVARLRGLVFTGFVAWFLWLVVHIWKLIGFRNRILVLINWAWNYSSYERAVRLILPSGPTGERERTVRGEESEHPGDVPAGERSV